MGTVKRIERVSKRSLMSFLGRFISAPRRSPEFFRLSRFDRILVIRQHNQMGDMLLAIPAFRAIRRSHPEAVIGVVTSTLNRDVLVNNPYIDRLYTYDKRNPLSHLRLIRDLRRERYALAIVLHTVSFSFTSLVLAVLSGAALRIGSTSRYVGDSLTGSYLSLTLPLPDQAELDTMNESEHNLYPLRAVGIDTDDLSPLIVPAPANARWAQSFAEERWSGDGLKLIVHPGAGKAENTWPADRFAEVVNTLDRIRPVNLVVIEGPRDAKAVAAFSAACAVGAKVVRKRGIGDVAALLLRADLVICNDTGVMHVAAAVGANTLAIFGPTDPDRWAPRSPRLHIVRAADGRMESVTARRVVQQAVDVL
jgi:ADP-heptose:LPS heptosyltransferase